MKTEFSKKIGQFLMEAYKRTGCSKTEAAERAGISAGHLSGLLSGHAGSPKPETLRRMAEQWGFNLIDFYKAVGLLTDRDLQSYSSKNVLPNAPADVLFVYDKLMSMPPEQRRAVEHTIHAVIDTYRQLQK